MKPVYFIARYTVILIAQIHVTRRCGASDQKLGEFALRAIVFVALMTVWALIFVVLLQYIFNVYFGMQRATFNHPVLESCVLGRTDGTQCTDGEGSPLHDARCTPHDLAGVRCRAVTCNVRYSAQGAGDLRRDCVGVYRN